MNILQIYDRTPVICSMHIVVKWTIHLLCGNNTVIFNVFYNADVQFWVKGEMLTLNKHTSLSFLFVYDVVHVN